MDPETNDQMTKLGATGTCHLHVANSELRLLCAKDGRLLVAWPFTCLRRYMSTRGKFTVEAGRRAPTGEGKFTFLTPQHDEIYKLLDNVVKSRAGHKPSHETLKKTQSVPVKSASASSKDIPSNGYDHLSSTPVPSSATDQNLFPGMTNSMKNTYSAPYGHLPSRDVTRTATPPPHVGQCASQALPAEDDQYNTLSHPVQGSDEHGIQHGKKGLGTDEYNTFDQHLASPQQEQDMYNVLQHGPKPRAGSQQQQTEDVYNVIGETLHPVLPASNQGNEDVYAALSTSQRNVSPSPISAPEETYNTLDHGSPVMPPRKGNADCQGSVRPPRPPARKLFDSSPNEVDNMYNTLNEQRHPPLPVRKTLEQPVLQKSQPEDDGSEVYNTLDSTSKARPPAPIRRTSAQLKNLQKSESLSFDETDMYNTLDSSNAGNSTIQSTSQDNDEMYNTLDVIRVGTSPIPARPKSWTSPTNKGEDMYNTLDNRIVISSPPRNDDDMYNTLDKTRVRPTLSVPVPPQRSFLSHDRNAGSPRSSPAKKDTLELKGNSTSSLHTMRCPLDVSSSQTKTRQHVSSLDDPDSYASIDYTALLSSKGAKKQPPIPAKRSNPPKARKTSAPDVLSFTGHTSGKDIKKLGKGGLVSNLKASLEAGGLDLTKLPRKPKKLSREGSEDLSPCSEVADVRGSQALAEDVFVSGTPPTKSGRSQSSPSEAKPGEDIYDELEQTAQVRPKSLQLTKAKKSPKK